MKDKKIEIGTEVIINNAQWSKNQKVNKNGDISKPGKKGVLYKSMLKYLGQKFVVCGALYGGYRLTGRPHYEIWYPWMFEIVPKAKDNSKSKSIDSEAKKIILKVGMKVRIKSRDWWNKQLKDDDGDIAIEGDYFTCEMASYCGEIATITDANIGYDIGYATLDIDENEYVWSDWMFDVIEDEYLPQDQSPYEVLKSLGNVIIEQKDNGSILISPIKKEIKKNNFQRE